MLIFNPLEMIMTLRNLSLLFTSLFILAACGGGGGGGSYSGGGDGG